MNKHLSEVQEFLEGAAVKLNEAFFDGALSKTVITVQKDCKNYGHFTHAKVWRQGDGRLHEINLSAEHLNRPVCETVTTLLHELVHLYCFENNIKDTCQKGIYHNKNFKVEAEKRGLIVSKIDKHGFAATKASEKVLSFYAEQGWNQDILLYRESEEDEQGKKPSSTRKYICPSCNLSVRATKDVRLKCCDCNVVLEKSM